MAPWEEVALFQNQYHLRLVEVGSWGFPLEEGAYHNHMKGVELHQGLPEEHQESMDQTVQLEAPLPGMEGSLQA